MLIGERQQRILEELKKNPNITVSELANKLFVSEPTVVTEKVSSGERILRRIIAAFG